MTSRRSCIRSISDRRRDERTLGALSNVRQRDAECANGAYVNFVARCTGCARLAHGRRTRHSGLLSIAGGRP
jgi:hypothetical protein